MRNIISLILSLVIAISAFASVYSVSQDLVYNTYTRKVRKPIYPIGHVDGDEMLPVGYEEEEIIIDPRTMELDELEQAMKTDYENLKAINPECKGWFNLSNIGYYPIMQTTDNNYYLHYNEYKEWYDAGAPFLDKKCAGFEDVALIYGHHFTSGRMFGAMEKYKQADFFNGNDELVVYDGTNFRYYKPFTVYVFGSMTESVRMVFKDEQDRTEYLKKQQGRSLVYSEEQEYDSPALFFQTCDYTFYNARLVIGFRQVSIKKG